MTKEVNTAFGEALEKVSQRVRCYVERGPYELFPDEVVVRNALVKMARNLVEHGQAYCPCREVTGDAQADRLNICPCRSHHQDIARDGYCECRLFVSDEFLQWRKSANQHKGV